MQLGRKWLDLIVYVNGSWNVWMSHGTCGCIIAHMSESWHMCTSHGTCGWVVVCVNESWHMHITHMHATRQELPRSDSTCACGTCEWVVAHVNELWYMWMSHGTCECVMVHVDESWHVWMSHGTYEWVMTHVNASWHMWVTNIPRTDEMELFINNYDYQNNQQVFTAVPVYTSNTCLRESPKFQTSFQLSQRSPRHSKDLSGKLVDLEIQIFEVWSPLWVECDTGRRDSIPYTICIWDFRIYCMRMSHGTFEWVMAHVSHE